MCIRDSFYIGHTLIGNNALWLAFTLYMFLRGVLQYFMTPSLRTIYRLSLIHIWL